MAAIPRPTVATTAIATTTAAARTAAWRATKATGTSASWDTPEGTTNVTRKSSNIRSRSTSTHKCVKSSSAYYSGITTTTEPDAIAHSHYPDRWDRPTAEFTAPQPARNLTHVPKT